jgi:hypothetical protein
MQRYGRSDGTNGVSHYELGPGFICLRFRHERRIYVYTDHRPGRGKVMVMQHLALEGSGLAEFVHDCVRGDYDHWQAGDEPSLQAVITALGDGPTWPGLR